MRHLESSIERKVCTAATKLGVPNIKLQKNGWPDRCYLIHGGTPLFIEFKRPGEEPRPLQLHIHQQLRDLGYKVHVCDEYCHAMSLILHAIEEMK